LILGGWTLAVTVFSRGIDLPMKARVLGVMGLISVGFLLFTLLTSNPFERVFPAPADGNDLNPLLQDPGMAIHPPMLYMGYVGFVVAFAFAVAALLGGRLDDAWARASRPWTLAAWSFLTVGIALGSFWAYYELGWGGWWFWDPVENASFMPWLVGTALIHSLMVTEKRGAFRRWTVLLAILAFSLSLLGTFIVRSGVLSSVHAFATDPARGVFILAILVFFIGGALMLFAWRAQALTPGGIFAPISREGALVLNNLFLSTAVTTVLVGTLYPLVLESITGEKISVGEPFFNLTFGPLMVPLLLAVPFGPMLAWKRADLWAASQRLVFAFGGAVLAMLVTYSFVDRASVLAAFGIGLGAWLVLGALTDLATKSGLGSVAPAVAVRRFLGLPRSAYGTALAHLGVGLTTLGVVGVMSLQTEHILTMKPGDSVAVAGYELRFEGLRPYRGPNYTEDQGRFVLTDGSGRAVTEIVSSKRFYPARQMPTTEAGIATRGVSQLYVALGDPVDGGGIVVRIWWKPLVTLIWLGCVVMMGGGILSLLDRRLRVGAPAKRRKRLSAAEATA
jgi:cytochrome c-type biogenesis protein CcmF